MSYHERMTREELILALLIQNTATIGIEIDSDTTEWLRDLFFRLRPDKFVAPGGYNINIVSAKVMQYSDEEEPCYVFKFNNGYIWQTDLEKYTSNNNWESAIMRVKLIMDGKLEIDL